MSGIFRTFNLLDDEIAVEVGKTIYGRWQRAVGQGLPVGIDLEIGAPPAPYFTKT